MSNDNVNLEAARAEQERLRRQSAEMQRDLAVNVAADQAVQRDAALNVATDRAVERDAATTAATIEAARRQEAEQSAAYARTAANQASYEAANAATQSNVLRENLAAERAEASNANFGFYLMAFCVLAALIGLGIWYFNSNPTTTAYTNQSVVPASSTTITTPAPPVRVDVHTPPAMPAPSSTPVIVNPTPQAAPPAQPPANVKVDVNTHPNDGGAPASRSTGSGNSNPPDNANDSNSDSSKSSTDESKNGTDNSGGQ